MLILLQKLQYTSDQTDNVFMTGWRGFGLGSGRPRMKTHYIINYLYFYPKTCARRYLIFLKHSSSKMGT